ncbi:MAG: hypothetical protein VXW65_10025 [Pseudomonadota bacterium]|nr:hypothetical protein [Pseudomonadota bacterium]
MKKIYSEWTASLTQRVTVTNFGDVYRGKVGYADCTLELSLTQQEAQYWLRLMIQLSKSAGLSKTQVIQWPYSDVAAEDLRQVVADFTHLIQAKEGQGLRSQRGRIARWFDRLLRMEHLGVYIFQSVRPVQPEIEVKAELVQYKQGIEVWLSERRGASSSIVGQFPLEACDAILHRLTQYGAGRAVVDQH